MKTMSRKNQSRNTNGNIKKKAPTNGIHKRNGPVKKNKKNKSGFIKRHFFPDANTPKKHHQKEQAPVKKQVESTNAPKKRCHEEETNDLEPREKKLNIGKQDEFHKARKSEVEQKIHKVDETKQENKIGKQSDHIEAKQNPENAKEEGNIESDAEDSEEIIVCEAEQNSTNAKVDQDNAVQEDTENKVEKAPTARYSLINQNIVSKLPTREVAIDCEMVGAGRHGYDSILARVSVVNRHGGVLYDKFVRPTRKVMDYRTEVSGVRPEDVQTGERFSVVRKQVEEMLKGKILVGHSVQNDLDVLHLSHPQTCIRDTARYNFFRAMFNGKTPSLKNLTKKVLDITIQDGEHSSVIDAQATMKLYDLHRQQWEENYKNCPQAIRFMLKHSKGKQQHPFKKPKKKKVKVKNMFRKKKKSKR